MYSLLKYVKQFYTSVPTDLNKNNLILKTDSYKVGHWGMYQSLDLHKIYSYFEARKGAKFSETTFFGLQYFLKQLEGIVITREHITEAKEFVKLHLGDEELFNEDMWTYILQDLGGKLPLVIRAVPEGMCIPEGNVLMTIENTDPRCAALVNHFETLLTHIWYTSTVATQSREIKKILKTYLDATSDKPDHLQFQMHDFGERGVSSMETAGLGGMAHLVNFMGTDTIEGVLYAKKIYGEQMAGYSVVASEHSVMTSRMEEGEFDVLKMLLEKYPKGILSLVLDSYDIDSAVLHLTTEFLPLVKSREGKVVIRPDSGKPVDVTLRLFKILEGTLSSDITLNSKGYKCLPNYIGIIYGDGLDIEMIQKILITLKEHNWASDNIVFGMGGGLLQKVNRDTQRFAFKCSANQTSDGVWHDVYKNPIDARKGGDTKASKKGKLKLIQQDSIFMTVRQDDPEYMDCEDLLIEVFRDGEIKKLFTFQEIRQNSSKFIN
jgi:nicotinamide phosphoribosyltransferase